MKMRYKLSTTAMRVQPAEMTRARSWKSRGPTILTSDTVATLASWSGHIQPVITPCAEVCLAVTEAKPLGVETGIARGKNVLPISSSVELHVRFSMVAVASSSDVYRVFLSLKPTGGNSRSDSQQRGARANRIVANSDRCSRLPLTPVVVRSDLPRA
jgi:hypothetical protein